MKKVKNEFKEKFWETNEVGQDIEALYAIHKRRVLFNMQQISHEFRELLENFDDLYDQYTEQLEGANSQEIIFNIWKKMDKINYKLEMLLNKQKDEYVKSKEKRFEFAKNFRVKLPEIIEREEVKFKLGKKNQYHELINLQQLIDEQIIENQVDIQTINKIFEIKK